jgi:hypothetical protein
MQFDVIIGNPPYQLGSDGGTRDVPIYQHFVKQAKMLQPRFLTMVIPARWMASGLGLREFRQAMLGDRRIRDMARQGAMNLHTGMSPEYRGADCTFWPVHNGDLHLVGATIHECTARIDGGDIYECAPAHIRDGDGRFAVFGRCVRVGAVLYVDAIRSALNGSLTGSDQDPAVGHEYRAADMRLRHDLYVRWLHWRGIASDRAQASRVSGSIR